MSIWGDSDMSCDAASVYSEDFGYSMIQPGSLIPRYSREWLKLHIDHVMLFISRNYISATPDRFFELARKDPCLAHEIIADWLLPNEYKLWMIRNYITNGSKIGIIEGDRGEGKTTAAHSFAEMFLDVGRQPYWVGPPQPLPEGFGRVIDPYNVPPGKLAVTDEIAIKYSARKSGSVDNIEDTKILLTLRQSFRSSLFITQLSSLTDLNFVRTVDYLAFKPLSLFGRQLEREVIGSAIPPEFMPKSKFYTHFFCKDFRTTIRHPLPESWIEAYSFPFAQITEETVHRFVADLLGDGFTEEGIVQELKARSYRADKTKVKEIIQWHQKMNLLKPDSRVRTGVSSTR